MCVILLEHSFCRKHSFDDRINQKSAKTSLYISPLILSFRVTIGPAEKHDMDSHIMTNPPPCLTFGRRLSRSHARAGVLQTSTCPAVGKGVKDDWSDRISFFLLSID
ncbi:hypothetical protein TNCV_2217721 [Trichonephila clavipes]|nr:hypothetical protein TNCV_2217721 [Trichonephila clavipes]